MATYNGSELSVSEDLDKKNLGSFFVASLPSQWVNCTFDTAVYFEDTQSLRIGRGGFAELLYTLSPGDHNVSVYARCFSTGGCRLHVIDGAGDLIQSVASTVGGGTWAKIEVDVTVSTWTLYKIKLINDTDPNSTSDLRVWFDKVVVL